MEKTNKLIFWGTLGIISAIWAYADGRPPLILPLVIESCCVGTMAFIVLRGD